MKFKTYFVVAALMVASYSIGRFTGPSRVEVKEVERTSSNDAETISRNQEYIEVIREILQPDGTKITETRKEKETNTTTARQSQSETQKEMSRVEENRPSFRVGVIYEPPLPELQDETYAVILEKRLISEFYIGISVSSDKTVGVSFSLGF